MCTSATRLGIWTQSWFRAVEVTLANAPEASVTEGIARDLAYQEDAEPKELHIDRVYLSSELVR